MATSNNFLGFFFDNLHFFSNTSLLKFELLKKSQKVYTGIAIRNNLTGTDRTNIYFKG